MNFRVIPASNSKEWNKVLTRVTLFDFYHTSSYHRLDHTGEARLLVFEENEKTIAIPFLFRKILNTDLLDITSIYGYAGWIRNSLELIPEMFPVLKDYLRDEKVVSAFSRLHPLIIGSDRFECGEVTDVNTSLAIDLSLPDELQFRSYSESVRRSIARSRKAGVTVRIAKTIDDVLVFAKMYRDAMVVLDATPSYHFSDEYFIELFQSTDYDKFIIFSEMNGIPIGGGLFTICNGIMQYHLGAIVPAYRSLSPLKFLIDEARKIGNNQNLAIFHLGGGVGGKDDSLFVFKSRMATSRFQFKVWRWIVDEENYYNLSESRERTSFFPLYRA